MKRIVILLACTMLAGGTSACARTSAPSIVQTSEPGGTTMDGAVQTLCLETEQYPDEYSWLTIKAARRILDELDWRVEDQGEPCDATLNLALTTDTVDLAAAPPPGPENYVQHALVEVEATFTIPGQTTLVLPVGKNTSVKTEYSVIDPAIDMLWDTVLLDSLTQTLGPQVLVVAIKDQDVRVRSAAAKVFGTIGSEAVEAIPTLIQMLKDQDADMCRAAVMALESIGAEAVDAVPALAQILADGDSDRCIGVPKTLTAITGQDFGDDAVAWLTWWEAQ
ncbi:MAG: HEAT repeat domain-containing protein [Chloroflexi bacterium]|nr:HEAT repeat domain-containing protein [Chloroflexota bacterium]